MEVVCILTSANVIKILVLIAKYVRNFKLIYCYRKSELNNLCVNRYFCQAYSILTIFIFTVQTAHTCSKDKALVITEKQGSISSSVARQTGCGSMEIPWQINLKNGQRADFHLVTFPNEKSTIDTKAQACIPLG